MMRPTTRPLAAASRRRAGNSPVLQRLRTMCLAFPETSEAASWGHPNFKAGKKVFVAFEQIDGRPSVAFRLDPVDVDLLLRRAGFFATPYGRGQWVSMALESTPDWALVRQLVEQSYRLVALKRMVAALDAAVRQ